MTPEHWGRVKRICTDVWETSVEPGADRLSAACAGDQELRRSIDDILLGDAEAGDFLETPPVVVGEPEPEGPIGAALEPGTQIGRYAVVRKLAEGGMGSVYLAEQESPKRHVALKLLPSEVARAGAQRAFEREAEVLGRLRHLNIAQIYEGGVWSPGAGEPERPYLAMELVEGESINRYCDERELGAAARIELFLGVCDALTHAHQRAVIHRDIKPSNVLVCQVDGVAVPKVIDFGIARIDAQDMERTLADGSAGRFAGSIPYMSPEQVRCDPDIDTRTDVYSLGVLLYLLLTGAMPYKAQSPFDFMHAIGNGVIIAPRRRVPALARDLQAVLMRGLEPEAQARFGTVSEFSDNLRAFLQGAPVPAARGGLGYRIAKWTRRHRMRAAAMIGAAILTGAGVGATAWQSARATRSEAAATRNLQDLRTATSLMLNEMQASLQNLRGASEARRLLVERGLEVLHALEASSNDDPSLLRDLAFGYATVGMLQGHPNSANNGQPGAARESLLRSVEMWNRLTMMGEASFEDRVEHGATLRWLASLDAWLGEPESSLRFVDRCLVLHGELESERPGYRHGTQRAISSCWLTARYLKRRGFGEYAAQLRDRAVRILADHPRPPADARDECIQQSICWMNLGSLQRLAGEPETSLECYEQARVLADRGLASGGGIEDHRAQPGNVARYAAEAHWESGSPAQAIESIRSAVRIFREVCDSMPEHSNFSSALAQTTTRLAEMLLEFGSLDEARIESMRARELASSLATEDLGDQRLWFEQCYPIAVEASVLATAAATSHSMDDWRTARLMFQQALEIASDAESSGLLPIAPIVAPEELERRIERCDVALSSGIAP